MRTIKILISTFIGLFTFTIIWFYISNTYVMPWEKNEIIQTTLGWGGLANLPDGTNNLKVEKKGNLFTREFLIEFEVDNISEIQDWIQKSKRLNQNTPKLREQTRVYEIYPGEKNSMGGKVEILENKIRINMSWS